MPIQISERLKRIADEIPNGAFFADIGSDHAYLPCYVCLRDEKARAIAGEVAKGPYLNALNTVKKHRLEARVDVRFGDGLSVIEEDEPVDVIVIAGMGGNLIRNILCKGKEKLKRVQKLILQPNNNEATVRKALLELQLVLTNEIILEENGLIYEILIAEADAHKTNSDPYDKIHFEKQLMFGPYLLQEKPTLFIKKWLEEHRRLEKTIMQMKQSDSAEVREKIESFSTKLKWIEEAIS